MSTKRSEALSSQGVTRRKQGETGTSCTRNLISTEERHFYSCSLEQCDQECDKLIFTGSFQGAIGRDDR